MEQHHVLGINKFLIALMVLAASLMLSCSVGRAVRLPSAVKIGSERYYVDTLRQRWGRIGDAPYVTYLYFRNEHDTIVGTEKAHVVAKDVKDVIVHDSSNSIVAEYYADYIHPYYYAEDTLDKVPDSLLNEMCFKLNGALSPSVSKLMTDNHTFFSIEILVGSNGLILESVQRIFMDTLRYDKEMLDLCAKVDKATKSAPIYFPGSIWMRENGIPHGQIRFFLMMTEDGFVSPDGNQIENIFRHSKLNKPDRYN